MADVRNQSDSRCSIENPRSEMQGFKIALLQMFVEFNREKNLEKAARMIKEAASNGAKVLALPVADETNSSSELFVADRTIEEYFTCWMDPKYFIANQELDPGPTTKLLATAARDHGVYIFGGSFPETIPGSNKLFNTCNIFDPSGDVIAQFRKLHMFDVDLGPRMKVTESDLNQHGDSLTTVQTDFCKVGFGLCLDIRFPELSRLYTQRGCQLLNFMGGFSIKTGPAHLETLMRARAIDNQVFLANVGAARNDNAPYVTYGHSGVVDPWGDVVAKTGSDEDIVYADIDLSQMEEIRRRMPMEKLRRNDMYMVKEL